MFLISPDQLERIVAGSAEPFQAFFELAGGVVEQMLIL
jgi:hypothetical protein